MNAWFRLYHELLDDPKVQELSPKTFKSWINLLCLAARNDGVLPCIEDISFGLRLKLPKAQALMEELIEVGLVDNVDNVLRPHAWSKRQFQSDSSGDRVRRFRERQRNVTKPLQVTAPDQTRPDTDQTRPDTPIVPTVEKLKLGEYGHVLLTNDEHKKLIDKMNGNLADFIGRFDRFVQEAPDAKIHGVKRKDRSPYLTILNWYDIAVKKGEIKKTGSLYSQEEIEQAEKRHRAIYGDKLR